MYFFIFCLVFSAFFGLNAMAQTDGVVVIPETVTSDIVDTIVVNSTTDEAIPILYDTTQDTTTSEEISDELEDIQLDVPETAPTGWGLFWRGMRERVSVALTFDPLKKAEKQLKFAEERMAIAEKIASVSEDSAVQERAQQVIAKAQEMMDKVEAKKAEWLDNKDERVQKFLKNIATHEIRKEAVLDRIEAKIPEEKMAKWNEMRAKIEEKGKGILKAMENENLPEKVKEHLQNVKTRIEEHAAEVKEFQAQKKTLLEAVKNGDEGAKEQLQQLQETRKQTLEQNREEFKAKVIGLKESAQAGDVQAQKQLKMIKVEQKIKGAVIENRLEDKDQKLEKVETKLQEAVENGDESVINKLQRVEKVQDRIENRIEKKEERKLPPVVATTTQ